MNTFFIKTLGCKVSRYDSERISVRLQALGLTESSESPDIYFLNGCSVTARASQKVRQSLRAARKKWPNTKIVLSGCEAQLREQRGELTEEADAVLINSYSDEAMIELLGSLQINTVPNTKCNDIELTQQTRAFLKVQDGCNQFCTYCIVPYLRGKEWSSPIENVISDTIKLIDEGHKELVLTGIHIGHFKPSLPALLSELDKIETLKRVRISSIESIEVKDELINWMKTSKKSCHHFHLPLQSGCDKILKEMKRPYTTNDFREIVNKVRNEIPNVAISSDLIVGFPGETDEDFAETIKFVEEMNFSRIHIFRYSKRDGTPAAKMPNQLSNLVKRERASLIEKVWQNCANKFHASFVNKELEVLWENQKNGVWHGFSREYVPCTITTEKILRNCVTLAEGVQVENDNTLNVKLKDTK